MKSPFPGMDPYLEQVWPDFHTTFLTYLRDAMNPTLPDDLRARLQERVYVEDLHEEAREFEPDIHIVGRPARRKSSGSATAVAPLPPDVAKPVFAFDPPETTERYIDILDVRSGGKIITSIELLSPANKVPGAGRRSYIGKQNAYRQAAVNLVEIDLTRAGRPTSAATASPLIPPQKIRTMYHASIVDFNKAGWVYYYAFELRCPLPKLPIPLRETDAPIAIDLQQVLDLSYERGYYAEDLPYDQPPVPPLEGDDQAWARQEIETWRRARAAS